jgi:hypothetical protein
MFEGKYDNWLPYFRLRLGSALCETGDFSAAEEHLLAAHDALTKKDDADETKKAVQALHQLYTRWNKSDLAAKYVQATSDETQSTSPPAMVEKAR